VVISLLVPLWFSQIWQNLTKKKKPNLVKFTLGFFSPNFFCRKIAKFRHQKNHFVGGESTLTNSLHPSDGKHRRFRSQHKVCGLRSAEHPPTHPPARLAAHPSNRRARAGLVARQSGPETVALPVRYIPPFFSPRLHLHRPDPVGDFQSTARISQKMRLVRNPNT
jgi:hypothetical protein